MKKQAFPVLIAVTCVFVAFTAGFFFGSIRNSGTVQVSVSSTAPRHTETPTESTAAETEETRVITFPININTADLEELTALPGIGQVLGQRILDYRTENGSFETPEALLNVEGIGEGKLEDILDLIETGG